MARHRGIVVRALSWNLYHGRDFPPDPALFTTRSRLFGVPERNATHVQMNRPLLDEFAGVIAALDWDVALLQEAPPRWLRPLCRATGAGGASALTSRNELAVVRSALGRLNPDLIASNEGGSNQLLVRPPWRIERVRRHTLTDEPERRTMLWALLREPGGRELAVANLHATTGHGDDARRQVVAAAELAGDWAGGAPLVFGGDLNLRPKRAPEVFRELDARLGLSGATAPDAIDHLLARGVDVVEPPRALPPTARELTRSAGLALRLSDHAPVVFAFEMR
jgi:endonuclease/exonuclease/phosphatase family metal-dependent hydrolase